MATLPNNFSLEPHPSGKNTCKILTSIEGVKLFVKYPRDVENYNSTVEEFFAELLAENILSGIGINDLNSSIERVGAKLAIIQNFYPKNWADFETENLEILNENEFPLMLAAEALMRQSDRDPNKKEHIGLSPVEAEGISLKYRVFPLDLGHAFIGQPSGNTNIDEDFKPEWINSLFWATREFSKEELDQAARKLEELIIYELVANTVTEISSITNWPSETINHLKKHADNVTYFLYVRQKKLREVLLGWWDLKYQTSSPQNLSTN